MTLKYTEPGSGTNLATEVIASEHYNLVKLIAGNAGSTTPIPGSADGLRTEATRVIEGVKQESSKISVLAVDATVKRVFVDALTGGDRTIVAAVSGKTLRVISVSLFFTAAGSLTIKSGAGTDLASIPFAANGSWVNSLVQGLFETTTANQALVFNVSAGSVRGVLTYVEV